MVALLQSPSLWNVQGSITVVGILLVIVAGFYFGLLTTGRELKESRTRLAEREEENATLHAERLKDIEEKAMLRGEVTALRQEVAMHRHEVKALREEVERLRQSREG
jgi:ubiquinone biosynthesis protein UbiJ